MSIEPSRPSRRRLFVVLVLLGVLLVSAACALIPPGSQPTPGVTTPSGVPEDGQFSIAVIPDTQYESIEPDDARLADRAQWLVDNQVLLDLRYVLHTGDLVHYGAYVPAQFERVAASFDILRRAGVPYSITVGNHDTPMAGHDGVPGSREYGGAAYVNNPECQERLGAACRSRLLIRDTTVFNTIFPTSTVVNLGGTFEPDKLDNNWATFVAAGTKWLVLTLEFHARPEAIEWANDVVAKHPDHNVIVQTHSYLTLDITISDDNAGYGSTTGQYLYEHLIELHPNIKMVFSGHTGNAGRRVDIGRNGNTIISYLGAFHSRSTNPVRIVNIDVDSGHVITTIVAPSTDEGSDETWDDYATDDRIEIIRS